MGGWFTETELYVYHHELGVYNCEITTVPRSHCIVVTISVKQSHYYKLHHSLALSGIQFLVCPHRQL